MQMYYCISSLKDKGEKLCATHVIRGTQFLLFNQKEGWLLPTTEVKSHKTHMECNRIPQKRGGLIPPRMPWEPICNSLSEEKREQRKIIQIFWKFLGINLLRKLGHTVMKAKYSLGTKGLGKASKGIQRT